MRVVDPLAGLGLEQRGRDLAHGEVGVVLRDRLGLLGRNAESQRQGRRQNHSLQRRSAYRA